MIPYRFLVRLINYCKNNTKQRNKKIEILNLILI